jgi:hypothetical protein
MDDLIHDLLMWLDIYAIFMNGEVIPSYSLDEKEARRISSYRAHIFEQVENAAERVKAKRGKS